MAERPEGRRGKRESRQVLIVDDEGAMAEMLADSLSDRGYEATAVDDGAKAIELLKSGNFAAVVTDLRMAPVDGFAVLSASRALDPERPVIITTAFSAIASAVEAIRQGAYHYLAKPFAVDELCIFLARALDEVDLRSEARALRRALGNNARRGIVAKSASMQRVLAMVERVADSGAPVLITGETGTGKGQLAALLHARSDRADAPFVAVNCAALPENLLESELFGHVRGAFTGAVAPRAGLLVEATGGSLFLDEIGDMPLALQAKLLHALDRGAVRPVGADKERSVDVRLIAATHRNLRAKVADGTFREDLLYRLDVISIEVPPLRSRLDDLHALINFFFEEARQRYPQAVARSFSPDAMAALQSYPWPGNVRELGHVIERALVLSDTAHVGLDTMSTALQTRLETTSRPAFGRVVPMRDMQRSYAAWAVEQLGRNRTKTAEKLDIDYKTLAKLLDNSNDGP